MSNQTTVASAASRDCDAQIRKAAGSNSLQHLQQAIQASGYTAQELDTLPAFTTQGKSALQMAAWKGSLENVQYLVEQVGCDVNGYSQATYSYGKTPIFFAATQSRIEIVQYLLQCPNIHVAIVNNKGQSVWTLAASHDMPNTVLECIRTLETKQHWWNFRASYSDGLEYGDLDLRFLDRQLRPSDVVTDIAVNPTTKQSRKGGFARRNPQAAKEKLQRRGQQRRQKQQQQQQQQNDEEQQNQKQENRTTNPSIKSKSNNQRSNLTEKEELEWKKALEQLGNLDDKLGNGLYSINQLAMALLTLVRLGNKQRRAWMPQVVDCLARLDGTNDEQHHRLAEDILQRTHKVASTVPETERVMTLLDKISQKLHGDSTAAGNTSKASASNENSAPSHSSKWKASRDRAMKLLHSKLGQQACQSVDGLSIQQDLEGDDSSVLSMPKAPQWVDTTSQILSIQEGLKDTYVVAIDAEWYQEENSTIVQACTFQLAFIPTGDEYSTVHCFVVDLLSTDSDSGDYVMQAQNLILQVLEGSNRLILGFSIGHDIPILECYIGRKLKPTSLLDLQLVLQGTGTGTGSHLPGLRTCAAKFSSVSLSKEHQRSNWRQRPLSPAQLAYAGLDAVLLLYLLSEYQRGTPELQALTSS